jgi:HEAT repeat protein
MQQVPTKKILKLLNPANAPEVRCAAALVLAEVGVRDGDVNQALSSCLDDTVPAVRLQAIRAVGKLGVAAVLPRLLERIEHGGEESHVAAEAVARLGEKGSKALHGLMPRVAPGVRRTIAAALAAEGRGGADDALSVLLDKDPGVVEGALQSLIGHMPTLSADRRAALVEQLVERLEDRKTPLSAVSEAAIVRLLAALGDERAAPLFWERIAPPVRVEVRAQALQALGEWVETPSKEQLKRLLACAVERDFRVAAPALMILKRLPVTDKALPDWLALLDAPDVTGRRLALEKVGDHDTAAVAAALLGQLRHPDRVLREAALNYLAKLKHGRQALTTALLEAETPDEVWTLARTQVHLAPSYPEGWRDKVFAQASKYLEADDRRAEPLLFLLRETDGHDLRDRLEARALHWRKKKDYAQALHYLRLLARDPACGFSTRLELAACGLKVSTHDLSAEARANDPCLQQFVKLCDVDDATLLAALETSKWLEPEDLYYLGFHLAEQEGRAKKCAAAVLQLVSKRSPRSKLGQAAKSKLKSSVLD